eukprot:CAMPEP_0197033340 /NCGR_PEP_ID=MMETSP1384-20130603/11778_1 /TAXON_ID=29189 /ORGANISM="Ammonia sp." /LENGTH=263 /DNA_ID=CAMNT_0042463137 /DNA_START=132 /DNA_END=923 /DNA_ORIENTATION=+
MGIQKPYALPYQMHEDSVPSDTISSAGSDSVVTMNGISGPGNGIWIHADSCEGCWAQWAPVVDASDSNTLTLYFQYWTNEESIFEPGCSFRFKCNPIWGTTTCDSNLGLHKDYYGKCLSSLMDIKYNEWDIQAEPDKRLEVDMSACAGRKRVSLIFRCDGGSLEEGTYGANMFIGNVDVVDDTTNSAMEEPSMPLPIEEPKDINYFTFAIDLAPSTSSFVLGIFLAMVLTAAVMACVMYRCTPQSTRYAKEDLKRVSDEEALA